MSDAGSQLQTVDQLTVDQADAVVRLSDKVAAADGVAGLSERTLLGSSSPDRHHVLLGGATSSIGYVQVWPEGAAELIVDPDRRRQGHGTVLWATAVAAGAQSVWAHGDLTEASAFAAQQGLHRVRELHRMERPLTPVDAIAPPVPDRFIVETYASRRDPDELLNLNARAFAHHAEQGNLTPEDLRARLESEWFDPAGLIYLIDGRAPSRSSPVAFHWTKRPVEQPQRGEVYVLGVDPAYQGQGLAQPLTRLGLAHMASAGARVVELYVDGDNEAALATYRRTGFDVVATDVVYALG
ncbi:MAG: mycothiol synthase [Nostocoides sp.]